MTRYEFMGQTETPRAVRMTPEARQERAMTRAQALANIANTPEWHDLAEPLGLVPDTETLHVVQLALAEHRARVAAGQPAATLPDPAGCAACGRLPGQHCRTCYAAIRREAAE